MKKRPSRPKKPKHKNRRFWNIFINPRYQIRYIFWITGTGAVLVSINTAVFYWYIRENYKFLVELSPMTEDAKQQLFGELNEIVWILGGVSIAFIIFAFFFGLVQSHRTAGPLYNFKRVFLLIRDGGLQNRVKLRPDDDFQDVAIAFNEMMDRIEKGRDGS